MKKNIITSILGLALTSGISVTAANVTGTVTLKGTAPKEKNITPLKEDPTCGKLHSDMPTTRFYVTGPNGGLADVVVSVEGVSGKSKGASAKPVLLDQKDCLYVPQIIAIQTGQNIEVRNSDPVMHNVHALPTVPGNKEENKVQMAKAPDLVFAFDKPEEFVKFKCDVHPWMFAWVSVLDHPYFDVTKENGSFKIENLPPGKYKIKAIHRKAGSTTQEIEVKDGQDNKIEFVLDAK